MKILLCPGKYSTFSTKNIIRVHTYFDHNNLSSNVMYLKYYTKVKQSHYRPGQALRVPGD